MGDDLVAEDINENYDQLSTADEVNGGWFEWSIFASYTLSKSTPSRADIIFCCSLCPTHPWPDLSWK